MSNCCNNIDVFPLKKNSIPGGIGLDVSLAPIIIDVNSGNYKKGDVVSISNIGQQYFTVSEEAGSSILDILKISGETFGVGVLVSGGAENGVIFKYDDSGNVIATATTGNGVSGANVVENIKYIGSHIYVTGKIGSGATDFNGAGVATTSTSFFVAKLDFDLNQVWYKFIISSKPSTGFRMVAKGSNVYIVGTINTVVSFTDLWGNVVVFPSDVGNGCILVVSIDTAGTSGWLKFGGGSDFFRGYSIDSFNDKVVISGFLGVASPGKKIYGFSGVANDVDAPNELLNAPGSKQTYIMVANLSGLDGSQNWFKLAGATAGKNIGISVKISKNNVILGGTIIYSGDVFDFNKTKLVNKSGTHAVVFGLSLQTGVQNYMRTLGNPNTGNANARVESLKIYNNTIYLAGQATIQATTVDFLGQNILPKFNFPLENAQYAFICRFTIGGIQNFINFMGPASIRSSAISFSENKLRYAITGKLLENQQKIMDFSGQIYSTKTHNGVSYAISYDFTALNQLFFVFNTNNKQDDSSEGLTIFNFQTQTYVGGVFGGGKSYNDKRINDTGAFLAEIVASQKPVGIAYTNTTNGITPTVILGRVEVPYLIFPFHEYFWQSGTRISLLPSLYRIGFGLPNNRLFVNTLNLL